MIRLIQRRLIIPRGDTGELSIPLLASHIQGETLAFFSILDLINDKLIYQQEAIIRDNKVIIKFEHEDTKDLPLGQYVWDIKIYVNPEYNETTHQLIGAEEINSYYAGFSYPVCKITLTRDRR